MWGTKRDEGSLEMERAYLLIAGILTGAAVGILTGQIAVWIPLGVVMGIVLSVSARRRPKRPVEPQ
jgi:F0F1-type ATP synthase assembly protein I